MTVFLGYAIVFGWVFLSLGAAQLAKKCFGAGEETSRKIVHISVAFTWFPMYFFFGTSWHLPVTTAIFIVLNYISVRKNIFSMMERSDSEKQSYGTVFYALSMTVMAVIACIDSRCMTPYGIAALCMALGDGFAPIFGSIKKGNRSFFGGKRSLYGCTSVFIICGAVVSFMSAFFGLGLEWWQLLIIAWGATAFEIVGVKGTDNLTLPLGVFALICLFVL
ncbi:MAG: hypothetical protein IJY96_06320 [Oscillospiraceae bacterium]|nr:hypothetical protein [Oscillospiraceae bacterium]